MRFLLCLLLSLSALSARAQYELSITLPRSNFMAMETIQVTVTVTNRTGAEAVLGGPGRKSWLSFAMMRSDDTILAQMDVDGSSLVRMPPGGVIQQKITVTDAYAPSDMGNYAIKARIYHTQTGDFYESNRARFSIIDSKPIWERSFGVPSGYKDAGKARRYNVIIFRDFDSTSLYFRLWDDRDNVMLKTYRLGPLSQIHDPMMSLDKNNVLHVLFMAQAHLFAHAIIGPDGVLKRLAYYNDEENGRPVMIQDGSGNIKIQGGTYFDPSKPPPAPKKKGGRGTSERPPGLSI